MPGAGWELDKRLKKSQRVSFRLPIKVLAVLNILCLNLCILRFVKGWTVS